MIIDCHTHIDQAGQKNWTAEQLIASMNEAHIDYSIVISNHMTDSPLNKLLAITKGNKRFKVMGNVEYKKIQKGNINMLISHLEKKNIVGVKLFPGYENYFPYDKKLYPLFTYLERNKYPLMIHSGSLMTGCKGFLEQAHPLHIDRVANIFPNLKIIIAHMGNPWLVDTIAVMWKNPNVYTDLSGFFDEFKLIGQGEINCFLQRMKDIEGLTNFDKFLFGTDFPLYSQKEYLAVIKKLPFTDKEKERVFWKNANEIFNLQLG